MMVDLQLYKLNTIVLADELPSEVDAIYMFAESDGVLRETQIAHTLELEHHSNIVALYGSGQNECYAGYGPWANQLVVGGIAFERLIDVPHPDLTKINTLVEATQLVKFAKEKGWKKILLIAPISQQLRAFMTVVAQLNAQNADVKVYNAHSCPLPWGKEILSYQGTVKMIGHELIDAEVERIEKYQAKGDVASYDATFKYLFARDAEQN